MEADERTGFDAFCGDPVFNETLLLTTHWPKFTNCFQNTLLVWVPCGWLWLALPFKMGYLCSYSEAPPIPFNKNNATKMFLSIVLGLLSAIDLLGVSTSHDDVFKSMYVAGALWTITYFLSAFLIQMEKSRGVVSSGVMWIFWFITLLANIVPCYTNIYLQEYDADRLRFILFYVSFACLVLQFLLACFGENIPDNGYRPTGKKPSPELSVSFPSRLIFWWLNGLILKGYGKPLTEDDVYDLNLRDKTDRILPPFTRAWNKELTKANKKRRREEKLKNYAASYSSQGALITSSGPLLDIPLESKDSNETTNSDPKEKRPHNLLNVSLYKQHQSLSKTIHFYLRFGIGVIFSTFALEIFKSHFLSFTHVVHKFLNPLIMSALISYTQELEYNKAHGYEWKGYILAISLFVANLSDSIVFQQGMHLAFTLGMRVKSVLVATVYRKSLTMSNEARKNYTMGEIVNLMSVDCQRTQEFSMCLFHIWSLPIQIAIAMYILWTLIGIATLAGVTFLVLIIPLNALVMVFNRRFQRKQLALKDKRMKMMGEVLSGIRVLKLYAWEPTFQKKVESIRAQELVYLRKAVMLRAFLSFLWLCSPFLVTVSTFTAYILSSASNTLDAGTAFEAIVLLNLLRGPITEFPSRVSHLVQLNVSLERLSKFLCQEDLKEDSVFPDETLETHNKTPQPAIRIEQGTFKWDRANPTSALSDISLDIPEGKLVAVVGQVGSGKSSLLSAMLGEMEKLQGQVTVKSSVAYVPQQAWIQNKTLRANILFGTEFKGPIYSRVIDDCALTTDLEILPAGDETEIGEKGINLSGGQKQRVSLARAVYNDADIYLLDDPLSAVDSHVAKHIFDHVISDKGSLKGKTRVLVTHGVQWLPQVDQIIVLSNGRVSEMGTYDELLSHDGEFAQFLKNYLSQSAESEGEEEEDPENTDTKAKTPGGVENVTPDKGLSGDEKTKPGSTLTQQSSIKVKSEEKKEKPKEEKKGSKQFKGKGRLVEKETAQTGNVRFSVVWSYFKAVGLVPTGVFLFFLFAYQVASVLSGIWVAEWTSDDLLKNTSLSNTSLYMDTNLGYLGIYGTLAILQVVLVLLYAYIMDISLVGAGRVLHNDMLENIMKNPMSFFDTTPSGRILNRFSRDVEVVDNQLPVILRGWLNNVFGTMTSLVKISYATPIFIVMIVPLSILYYLMQRLYIPSSRQLKRLESTTRSRIYTHFSETIAGAVTIRAYSAENKFIETSNNQMDNHLAFYYASVLSKRWLSIRLHLIGNILVLAAAMFLVITDGIDPSLVGLSISSVLTVTGSLNIMVRNTSNLETNIVSVERIREYSELPTEAPWINPMRRPKPSWPEEGYVHFSNYQTRYRPGLDLVLKGVNCSIKGGEKIGVVGRTGAGKSSLTLALFRLIEAADGSINIDGTDISAVGLHDLRSKVTILPQDPVLFSGTLRMNMDPIGQHDDVAIWQALEQAHLKTFVEEVSGGLSHECGEGGQNLSVGQRQLLCLARSLLRKTKILVLDEATAAVDMETDDLIQQTIRSKFKDCTVLSIAHRLNTILDYDRIMVLDQGHVVEMDTPAVLLNDKSSVFYGMAEKAELI